VPNFISEDQIEKAAIERLVGTYGYRTINCYTTDLENLADGSNRANKQDIVFSDILKRHALQFNPAIPDPVIDQALERFCARRLAMTPLNANREMYSLIRDGVPVRYENGEGWTVDGVVRLIDFSRPEQNDFLAVTQLWIKGERYPRRPDILIYVNGIPLVFIELKNSNVKVQNAYDDNLTNYRRDIPQLFACNGFCVLSNAIETKIGSFTAGYEHFFNWLRPDDEAEKIDRKTIEREGTSLERAIAGLFPKERLLDYLENFILYYNDSVKIVAQNHQFIGVNKAIDSFADRKGKDGKLGVFWHTQGSGKSFSMIFLARKIFRAFPGNYTFVIITDRDDLDGQIYQNFLDTGTVRKEEAARPRNSRELRDYLGRNMRLVFTLIQKFRYDKGKDYPVLSARDDIIVIVDEAHRTQYESLAENMHKGLPNAQFFAFTGTPILGKGDNVYKGKTWDWFGGYVSQYNFVQSVDDGATVPIFYQKRVPEVLIQNENLSDEFYQILEDENLDEPAQEKLEKSFSTEMEVIKRDDRLETIARDIVAHFPNRGYLGKGMVISVDKFTSVKMYDKVQSRWKDEIKRLVGQIGKTDSETKKKELQKKLDWMRSVEMAVVISEEAGEEERFAKQGLDIKPHRVKLSSVDENGHGVEYRFKQPSDPLQLVFVCAMWLTGFDAPTVSTLYLDKPMKGHTLMQTIARANRVTSWEIGGVSKANGEVVDYYNVFRNMRQALSRYAVGDDGEESDSVPDKSQIFALLDDAIEQGIVFCDGLGVDLQAALDAREVFKKLRLFKTFADKLLEKDERWKEFKVYENTISSLFEACKPEILTEPSSLRNSRSMIAVFQYLRGVLDEIIGQSDISDIKLKISELLDQSVVTAEGALAADLKETEYGIAKPGKTLDLSAINFDKLKEEFRGKEFKNIEIANLREFIKNKLEMMLKENSTRTNFAERLQAIINDYNSGGMTTENYYDDLVKFAGDMKAEDERYMREGLSKDELELFDILKKDKMTKEEDVRVKNAAKHLLKRLVEEQPKVFVQDWYKDSQSQLRVKAAIDTVLDSDLPESYDRMIFKDRSQKLYDLVFEYASKGCKWAS
jgi:type I restriction enzyme R subunit